MTKKISFAPRSHDAFVKAQADTPPTVEPTKRLTIEMSEDLHRRIKITCAARGTAMADAIRDLLEKEFPG